MSSYDDDDDNTRERILNDYVVENGIIKSPGKFEGQPIYAPYYWTLVSWQEYNRMICVDHNEENCEDCFNVAQFEFIFDIVDDDRKEFPELEGFKTVNVEESSDGFVYCNVE